MFKKIYRIINYLQLKLRNDDSQTAGNDNIPIPNSIDTIKDILNNRLSECSDLVLREITVGGEERVKVIVAYIDGLVHKELVNNSILKPLMLDARMTQIDSVINRRNIIDILENHTLSISEVNRIGEMEKSIYAVLSGDTFIYLDGPGVGLKIGTRGWEARGVEEPDTEAVVRGPREGFSETLRTNTALLRRKIKNPNLKFESMELGRQTHTEICISYIKGLANPDVISTVKRRLKRINIDAILESGYIEEFIEDAPYSLFPTVGNSEKPDIVAAKVLEGRIAIFCDGTPFVLTVPHLFIETLQASEDYYSRYFFSSLVRFFRILALVLSTTLPALYVAFVAFHQDVIPLKLLLTIAASREGIPFSAFTESLIMIVAFELLREAGVRMPRPIGQAVSIVGALVLGEAAVEAGIASNPVVMVTALTAITSFILTPLGGTLSIIRFAYLISANILGLIGMLLTTVIIFAHLCTLRSFGVPYMAPFSPLQGMDLKDTFIRLPTWAMWRRPESLLKKNRNYDQLKYRMKSDIRTKED